MVLFGANSMDANLDNLGEIWVKNTESIRKGFVVALTIFLWLF
jgi:hypothetical protein